MSTGDVARTEFPSYKAQFHKKEQTTKVFLRCLPVCSSFGIVLSNFYTYKYAVTTSSVSANIAESCLEIAGLVIVDKPCKRSRHIQHVFKWWKQPHKDETTITLKMKTQILNVREWFLFREVEPSFLLWPVCCRNYLHMQLKSVSQEFSHAQYFLSLWRAVLPESCFIREDRRWAV